MHASADVSQLVGRLSHGPQHYTVPDALPGPSHGGASHRGVSPVPEDALGGHAFHTYSLVSEDGLVEFQFRHNVQGRSVYAEGTVDAAVFLARRVAAADARTSYTMIDVLRAGAMD